MFINAFEYNSPDSDVASEWAFLVNEVTVLGMSWGFESQTNWSDISL